MTPGFKYNMMDIQAALGLHQLKRLDEFIVARTKLASRYMTHLADWDEWTLPTRPDYEHTHAWHLFSPCINPDVAGMTRNEFMAKLKAANIGTGLHYEAAHLFPYYQSLGFKAGDFPHAESIASRIVSLPLFPSMTTGEQDHVIQTMATLFNKTTRKVS